MSNKNKTIIKITVDKSWNSLIPAIIEIGNLTNYELVIGWDYSYWNRYGDCAIKDKAFGGYENIENIYKAVIEFIEWYNNLKS